MIFDRNEQKQVVALLGAGSMGTAIVRRIGAGKKILLGDISEQALERVGDDFRRCGYDVETIQVNAMQKESVEAEIARMNRVLDMLSFKCWYYEQAIKDGNEQRLSAMTPEEMPEEIRQAWLRAHEQE